MTHQEYKEIESFMLSHMNDSAHDQHHIYRVLNTALDLSQFELAVDSEVLVAACLLHDIGRERQFADTSLCHAQIGGEMAYAYLIDRKWSKEKATHVKKCVASHRYRANNIPESIEAKILFDADKLDASGAMGIARTLIYGGYVGEPLYILDENNHILVDGGGADVSSFFQEYTYKLKKIYPLLYTEHGKTLALERQKTSVDFYNSLFLEVSGVYKNSLQRLSAVLSD